MKLKVDYTSVLKRKIEEMIEDLKSLPIAHHAIRELRIVLAQLKIHEKKEEENQSPT